MTKPLISIIVPVYNVEKYLSRCIESLVNQTYKKLEIILVDDGSKDASGKICDSYASIDNRIIVIHKRNAGVVEARLDGYNKSTGDLVMFVDSDDYIAQKTVDIMVSKQMEENYDIVCCQYCNVVGNEIQHSNIRPRTGKYQKDEIENLLKTDFLHSKKTSVAGMNLFLCTKLIKRQYTLCALKSGKGLFWGEDQIGVLELLYNANNMYVCEDYLYFYVQHDNQTTRKYNINMWENIDAYFVKINDVDTKKFLNKQLDIRAFALYKMLVQAELMTNTFEVAVKNLNEFSNLYFCHQGKNVSITKLNFKDKIHFFFIKMKCWKIYVFLLRLYRM